MPRDTLPTTIVGSLPGTDDEIEIDAIESGDDLPATIIGTLPPPPREHRVADTNFTPDGKIVRCVCGWSSHLCHSDEQAEIEWLQHL